MEKKFNVYIQKWDLKGTLFDCIYFDGKHVVKWGPCNTDVTPLPQDLSEWAPWTESVKRMFRIFCCKITFIDIQWYFMCLPCSNLELSFSHTNCSRVPKCAAVATVSESNEKQHKYELYKNIAITMKNYLIAFRFMETTQMVKGVQATLARHRRHDMPENVHWMNSGTKCVAQCSPRLQFQAQM